MQSKFRSKFVILHVFLFKTNHFQHQILISFLLAAAIVQLIAAPPAAHAQTSPPPPAQLIWQGPAEMTSADRSQCASWRVSDANQATAQSCDGASQTQPLGVTDHQVWAMFRQRFAPFRYSTNVETVEFQGSGENKASTVWQRALLAWARGKYAEQESGKSSAAAFTVVSWYLGPDLTHSNLCTHLSVLAYGYAYAATLPCKGNQVTDVVGDWLTDLEIEKLDVWLYQRAPLYQTTNYMSGLGAQSMSPEEVTDAGLWAGALWSRVRATVSVGAPANTATTTATLTATETSFPTVTATKVATFTPSPIQTATTTATATPFPTFTATKAASSTPTPTVTASATRTPPMQITPQPTASPTMTARVVVSASVRTASPSTPSPTVTATVITTMTVTAPVTSTVQAIEALTNVNIRNGPGVTYPVVGRVTARQIVPMIGAAPENGWWRVICPTDATGNCFVSANPRFTRPTRLAPTIPLPAATLPAAPAAITPNGWLTYTDTAAKFTIVYPSTWTVTPRTDAPGLTGGVVSFQSSPTGLEPTYKIEIGQYQKPITNTADLAEWTFAYNQETSEFPAEQLKISVLEARTVDSLEAIFIRWSTPLGDSQYTNIRRGETVWFVWSNIGNLTDEETKTIYDQMVSSLNFE